MRINIPVMALLVIAASAPVCYAQQPTPDKPEATPPAPSATAPAADPFASAAARTKLTIYAPTMPEGFALGGVQLSSGTPDMLMASWCHSDGRQVHMMQSSSDGLECSTCETIDIDGKPSPYESYTAEDGDKVVDVTVIRGKTGMLIGLKGKDVSTNDALITLRKIAESLKQIQPAESAAAGSSQSGKAGLSEVSKQASFPVYTPSYLPEYFYLATAAHSPEGLASDGKVGTPEQVVVTYEGPNKTISVVVQPKGAFEVGKGRTMTIGGRKAEVARSESGIAVKVDCGDAVAVVSGDVAESTLVKVARSLKKT